MRKAVTRGFQCVANAKSAGGALGKKRGGEQGAVLLAEWVWLEVETSAELQNASLKDSAGGCQ